MRPADIVGAIANEADVPGREIGAIDIYDRFSIVEVPARYQQQVMERMSGATLRGRPLDVRLAVERTGGRGEAPPRGRGPGPGPRPFPRDRPKRPR